MVVSSLGCVLFWFYSPYRSFQFVLIFGCVLTHSYTHSFLHFAYTQAVCPYSACVLFLSCSLSAVSPLSHFFTRLCSHSLTSSFVCVLPHTLTFSLVSLLMYTRLCPHSAVLPFGCVPTQSCLHSPVLSLTHLLVHSCPPSPTRVLTRVFTQCGLSAESSIGCLHPTMHSIHPCPLPAMPLVRPCFHLAVYSCRKIQSSNEQGGSCFRRS